MIQNIPELAKLTHDLNLLGSSHSTYCRNRKTVIPNGIAIKASTPVQSVHVALLAS